MRNKITRRGFLEILGRSTFIMGAIDSSQKLLAKSKKKKPNVLMITIDDLRSELGCYGAKHIKSPNIDKLAAEGLLFNKAYIQQAVCAPSRASVLTGCRPDTTGVDFPYTQWFKKDFLKSHPDIQTYFFQRGYYTATYGKVHHGPTDSMLSEPHYNSKIKHGWIGENHQHSGPKPCVEMLDKPDNAYKDGAITDKAIERIDIASKKKEPFFMAVGYYKPHTPFVCPQKYGAMYKRDKIELSPVPQFPENSPLYSHGGKRYRDKNGKWVLTARNEFLNKYYIQNPGGFTEEFQRELRHGYYACISFIDAQIGRLIKALKKNKVWHNTIILLWSDQGYHLGDHNWWTKRSICEFDTRIPLIIRVPGQKTAGQKTNAIVEAVDIFPTLLDSCGFPIPDYMEGASFFSLVRDPRQQWKKAAFSQYPRGPRGARGYKEGYSVRTRNHRYTEWRNINGKVLAREFYDYTEDPLESKNLIGERKYKDLIEKHAKILKNGWKNALPPGIVNKSNNPMGNDSEYLEALLKKRSEKKYKYGNNLEKK